METIGKILLADLNDLAQLTWAEVRQIAQDATATITARVAAKILLRATEKCHDPR